MALKYMLVDDEMFKRSQQGLLLKCVNGTEAKRIIHEGICGAHKSGPKIRWLIHYYGYYWSTISANCLAYTRECEACQIHGPVQRVPIKELYAIVEP